MDILEIAKAHIPAVKGRGDLKPRNNDSEDFIDVSVWAIEAALTAAYEAGRSEQGLNQTGIDQARSAYLSSIGRSVADWYAVLGEFTEWSNYGKSKYGKVFFFNYGDRTMQFELTIRYDPEKGWSTELI